MLDLSDVRSALDAPLAGKPKAAIRLILTALFLGAAVIGYQSLRDHSYSLNLIQFSRILSVHPAVLFLIAWASPTSYLLATYFLWKHRRTPCQVFMLLGGGIFCVVGNPERLLKAQNPSLFWLLLAVSVGASTITGIALTWFGSSRQKRSLPME